MQRMYKVFALVAPAIREKTVVIMSACLFFHANSLMWLTGSNDGSSFIGRFVHSWLVSLITDVQKLLFSLCFSLGASHSKCSCHASFQNRVPLNLDFPAQNDIPQSFETTPWLGAGAGHRQPQTAHVGGKLRPRWLQWFHGNPPLIPTGNPTWFAGKSIYKW